MVKTLRALQGLWVRSLVGELRSHMLRGTANKKKNSQSSEGLADLLKLNVRVRKNLVIIFFSLIEATAQESRISESRGYRNVLCFP